MSTYVGNTLVAGATFNPTLLDFKWADHILNDISWLRADTFSWQPGSVYSAVYQHLANDINGKTLQSETVSGTTIQFYLSDDGHKVCPDSQESNVEAIYTATGVAWYYILDTTNQRFKLPRTKFGFTGLRDTVGNYVEPELPNITGTFNIRRNNNANTVTTTGAFSYSNYGDGNSHYFGNNNTSNGQLVSFNASSSNSIYKNNATVQPPATQMYLYFYVGNFTQTALENTAGVVTEDFNELNAHKVIAFQAPTAANNQYWYRKYADGWVEQGRYMTQYNNATTQITLPITMATGSFTVMVSGTATTTFAYLSSTGFQLQTTPSSYCTWMVCGMAA